MARKKICGIYKITSPSGRIYIGQSRDIERRFSSYTWKVMRNQHKLRHSFEKYGVDNHVFKIIEECKLEDLNKRERFYQEKYDAINQKTGLNCVLTKTDEKPQVFSEESKKRMSESNIKCMTPEVREKIRQSMMGKEVPQERRDRISAAMKGVEKSKKTLDNMSRAQKEAWKNREYTEANRESQREMLASMKKENKDYSKPKIILDLLSGVYYNSISDTCSSLGLTKNTIYKEINKPIEKARFTIV